jgi:hypothetical protein
MTSLRRSRPDAARHRADPLPLTIRPSFPDDLADVARLAVLDEARVPSGPLLLAEVAGELWLAASLSTLEVIADPFKPSGDLAPLVLERARQLRGEVPTPRRRRWRLAGRASPGLNHQ